MRLPTWCFTQPRKARTHTPLFLTRKQASVQPRTVGGDPRAGTPCVPSSPGLTQDLVFSVCSPRFSTALWEARGMFVLSPTSPWCSCGPGLAQSIFMRRTKG